MDKFNSQVTIQSPDGVKYKRNIAHLKKYESGDSEVDTKKPNEGSTPKQAESTLRHSTRIKKVPEKYED